MRWSGQVVFGLVDRVRVFRASDWSDHEYEPDQHRSCDNADPLDQVRQSTGRDIAVETLNQQSRSIREIRSALIRLAENSYRRCESCEQQIPAKRLDGLTWGTLMREVPIWKL